MNPPSHLTRSSGPVMPTIEEAPEHQAFRQPGRLAPKWLEDLLNGQLKDEPDFTQSLTSGCGQTGHRHELLSLGHQSITAITNAANDDSKEILSCICQHCRFQFVIEVETPGSVPCGLPTNYQDLFHHLVFKPMRKPNIQNTKYYPLLGCVEYQCSAPNCSTLVKVQVLRPRLTDEHAAFLLDLQSIQQRKAQAVAEDPEKYAGVTANACHLLWRYLKGVVAGDVTEDKKIAKQNKMFRINLGDSESAQNLLTYLDFQESSDGQSWHLPRPEITKPTPLGTQLAFLQNVKSELETLLDQPEQVGLKPLPILGFLKKTLHIEQEASTRVTGHTYNSMLYETLGITRSTHESVFWYAFSCQRQTDPDNTDTYLEAVRQLAVGRGDEDLEMKITTFESMRSMPTQNEEDEDLRRAIELSHADKQNQPVSVEEKLTVAYQHFGFEFPPSFDQLCSAFHDRCTVLTYDRINHIKQLALIGHFTKDAKITSFVKKELTLDDAFHYLDELPGTDPNIIETKAYAMENNYNEGDGGINMDVLLQALQKVSESQPMYASLTHTGAIINARHKTNYTTTHSTSSPIPEEAVDINLPVGLQNIRNTCYLNSILQYLFTVNPVREIVLSYDQFRLENTPQNIANRRIVARSLGPGDPYAGQEFVRELGSFFQELTNATTQTIKPKQRLALAAFKSAELLENDGAEMLKAPPLPPRPNEAAAPGPSGGPNVTVTSIAADDNADAASMVSSQTLANGNSEQGYVSISRDGAAQDVNMEAMEQPQDQRRLSTDSALDLADFEDVGDLPRGTTNREDTPTTDCPPPDLSNEEVTIVLEPTLKEKIARALDDDRVTGTAQEDVSEVMGTAINHLHAAIKPTGIDPVTGTQEDVLTDTFYWTGVSTRKKRIKESAPTRTLYKERTMTAYPDEHKTVSLVDALDRTFAREYIPDSNLELYQSILKLPPILHIQIQRTKPDSGKINTPIDIPQVLYLDRYMDADTKSELFKKRNRSWNITEKLQRSAAKDSAQQPTADKISEQVLAEYQRATIEEYMRHDEDDDITILSPELTALMNKYGIEDTRASDIEMKDRDSVDAATSALKPPDFIVEFEKKQAANAEKLRKDLIAEHAQLFDTLQDHKYLLHAVICHQGITGKSGHYWIYIFDFERQIWRKYNDTRVEEWATDKVLETLRSNGDPYYLSYVRADYSTEIVSIPRRVAPVQEAPSAAEELPPVTQDQDMPDIVDFEELEPLPPPYLSGTGGI